MYNFEVEKVTEACVEWIRDWFAKNCPNGVATVGISGGKDSSVTAALCVKALGKDRVFGVLMPNGEQADISDSHDLVDFLGINHAVVNIHDAVEGVRNSLVKADIKGGPVTESTQSKVNLPPRIRMSTLYYIAQSINGIVANTCNLSEDHVGYSTLFGDASGSFSPLGKLTVQEVKAIGRYLGLPTHLIDKAPSDGLCGKTDEDNLGFTYAVLDRYIRTGEIDDMEHKANIDRRYRSNRFKLTLLRIDTFDPGIEIAIEH